MCVIPLGLGLATQDQLVAHSMYQRATFSSHAEALELPYPTSQICLTK